MKEFVESPEFKDWLEKEIKLAMAQDIGAGKGSGVRRRGISRIRASRIIAKLTGFHVPDKLTISDREIEDRAQVTDGSKSGR